MSESLQGFSRIPVPCGSKFDFVIIDPIEGSFIGLTRDMRDAGSSGLICDNMYA